MDPAITAALVTTPTAVLAAAAAYAAGRAQARAAHRGPVDAIRRQHQRDAYAELTRAAWTYLGDAGSVTHLVQVVHKARLNNHELTQAVRYRLGALCLSSNPITKEDLADALAPAALPPSIDHAMKWLEEASPTWQQDIREAGRLDDLARAESVVALEGPDHLAELAAQLRRRAVAVQHRWAKTAIGPFQPPRRDETDQNVPSDELIARLKEAIQEFTRAARAYLNGH